MNIELKKITVGDLVDGYHDDGEGGVRGYGDKLDIRPPFQREFVYKDKQRDAVIETINKGFPLNVMYWAVRQDGTYEVIDGQQRTIAVAQYVEGNYSLDGRYFHNLQDDEQERIVGYPLQVYICEGSATEKLDWFRIINIAGERLTNQELRNAVYAGPWISDAKRYFSRKGASCPAYAIGNKYVNGRAERQEYLETAIRWIKDEGQTVEEYMAVHQHHKTATALWNHFQSIINRVEAVFPNYRKPMKGVDWGGFYGQLRDESLDPEDLEARIIGLMIDDDVTQKAGIYPYLLTGEERRLNIRAFSVAMKMKAFEKQKGICKSCEKSFQFSEMEGDHITPWAGGGRTTPNNCQMLCKECNRRKSSK